MKWETPRYVEIKPDAEATAYKDDFRPAGDPLFNAPRPSPESSAALEGGAAE
jgi:hypothetical protein